jgi:hypothetical protein
LGGSASAARRAKWAGSGAARAPSLTAQRSHRHNDKFRKALIALALTVAVVRCKVFMAPSLEPAQPRCQYQIRGRFVIALT